VERRKRLQQEIVYYIQQEKINKTKGNEKLASYYLLLKNNAYKELEKITISA
jgi:hypothetical protein